MHSPDAIGELLSALAPAVLHVSEEQQAPYFHIKPLPGIPTGRTWESIDRVQVELWATGYDPSKDLAAQASQVLQGWKQTSLGKIDLIEAEVPFSHEPIDHDTLNKFSGTFLITFRN